jgi:hypothetical protein
MCVDSTRIMSKKDTFLYEISCKKEGCANFDAICPPAPNSGGAELKIRVHVPPELGARGLDVLQ